MALTLDGVVVQHTTRPVEQLYERSPILFAGFVFLTLTGWILLAQALDLPFWSLSAGIPVVLIAAVLAPHWLILRNYTIEGGRTLIADSRGLQIEGILIPWSELHFHDHGDRESSMSLWEIGSGTIIATFEHENRRFTAFLGVRFKPLAPIAYAETLTKTLSEKELLTLTSLIAEHTEHDNVPERLFEAIRKP